MRNFMKLFLSFSFLPLIAFAEIKTVDTAHETLTTTSDLTLASSKKTKYKDEEEQLKNFYASIDLDGNRDSYSTAISDKEITDCDFKFFANSKTKKTDPITLASGINLKSDKERLSVAEHGNKLYMRSFKVSRDNVALGDIVLFCPNISNSSVLEEALKAAFKKMGIKGNFSLFSGLNKKNTSMDGHKTKQVIESPSNFAK